MTLSSAAIAKAMVRQVFQSKAVLIVPECYWTGSECDLLVVMPCLRVVDVEIKVSRADFRRDAAKDKWWRSPTWAEAEAKGINRRDWNPWAHKEPRQWPRRVWKHYFAMPEAIWTPDLVECLPSPASGVILLREREGMYPSWRVERRATPNLDAEKIEPKHALDIARLAGLRMWDALAKAEAERMAA